MIGSNVGAIPTVQLAQYAEPHQLSNVAYYT